jgi:hypothetical protein
MNEYRANRMKVAEEEVPKTPVSAFEPAETAVPANEPSPAEGATPTQESKKKEKKALFGRKKIQEVLGGDYLSSRSFAGNMPFVLYLAILAVFYISNTYNTERMYAQIEKTKTELKELRYQYITARAALMFQSKLSEINKRTQALGLKETLIPPYKIFYSADSIKQQTR